MRRKNWLAIIVAHLAVFLLSLVPVAMGEMPSASFTLNGRAINPPVQDLKSLGINRNEILVDLGYLTLLMDKRAAYAFTGDLENDGKLYEIIDDNKKLVGVSRHWTYAHGERVHIDPFASLEPEHMQSVRGVLLDDAPSQRALELLGHMDPGRAFITVTQKAAGEDGTKFPAIPATTQFLNIYNKSSDGIKEYSHLSLLNSLVYLRLLAIAGPETDIALFKRLPLRYLNLSGQNIKNFKLLGNLRELRYLDLSHCANLEDIEFTRQLPQLERLMINDTRVSDLSALHVLERITHVNANDTKTVRLPRDAVKHLKELKIINTSLTAEDVSIFQAMNPQCRVSHDWTETLHESLGKIDKIRVRSGGTCHRDVANEQTLFEIENAVDIRETLTNLRLDSAKSGFHCMCCGYPSFEFYRDGVLVVTLGFHHGRSLRWQSGDWPGDGLLTGESADFLCRLLDKHGIKGPLAERLEAKKREESAARRWRVYEKLLPTEVMNRLTAAGTSKEALNAFLQGEKIKAERVALGLRVLGCDYGSWNHNNLLDPIAIALLENKMPENFSSASSDNTDIDANDKISTTDIINVLQQNKSDTIVQKGAARWFFGEKKYDEIPGDRVGDVLPLIAEHGLTHPRQINRRRTLVALNEIGNDLAIEILRDVLRGKFKVVALPPDEAMEPGGSVEFRPKDSEVDNACSDQAYAALILAKLGVKDSLGEIRKKLDEENSPETKQVLEGAVSMLENVK